MPNRLAATELSFQRLTHLARQADGRLLRDLGFTNPDTGHRYLQLTFDPPGFARALAGRRS